MSEILKKDTDLFEKYKTLNNRNDKETAIEFLRIVNERH
jgi:hypothetical protein